MSYSYLPCITSSISQVLNISPISQVLGPIQQLPSLYHKYMYLSLVDRFILYITILELVIQLPPLYHKYWPQSYRYIYCSLSYSYLTYITSTGFCPTVSSPISQALVLALPVYSLYHKYWVLPYRYLS